MTATNKTTTKPGRSHLRSNAPTDGLTLAKRAVDAFVRHEDKTGAAMQRIARGIMLAYEGGDIVAMDKKGNPVRVTLAQCQGGANAAPRRVNLARGAVRALIGEKPDLPTDPKGNVIITDKATATVETWKRKEKAIKRAVHFAAIMYAANIRSDAFSPKGFVFDADLLLEKGESTSNKTWVLDGGVRVAVLPDGKGFRTIKMTVQTILALDDANREQPDKATITYADMTGKRAPTLETQLMAFAKNLDAANGDGAKLPFKLSDLDDQHTEAFDAIFNHLCRIMVDAGRMTSEMYSVATAPAPMDKAKSA